ncbi:MAG: hypothetical protein Q9204_008948, partial [Flavoplaca sp. TL-2023a]
YEHPLQESNMHLMLARPASTGVEPTINKPAASEQSTQDNRLSSSHFPQPSLSGLALPIKSSRTPHVVKVTQSKTIDTLLDPPPETKKSEDGRDQWPSRTAFLLASLGGAVGQGNIIRYPSQVFNNVGLQWFIPYLMAIFLLAIPTLILEVAIGQAYRGGAVAAYNNMNRRLRGVGLASIMVSSVVVVYFVIILVWIMTYFRHSFTSPLPWEGRTEEFYYTQVLRQVDPTPGVIGPNGVESFFDYNGMGLVGEAVGWSAFIWFCVYLCMFNGVGITGRAAYFTMALPIFMTIILLGRCCSLENAGRGIRLYFATWDSSSIASGQLWQTATGQVFFSTGVGFGYYIAYASYNSKWANAVQGQSSHACGFSSG